MRTVDATSMDWREPPVHHREGHIAFKRLLDGTPGTPDNYSFTLIRIEGGYHTPRHRHNYDQVRFCLSGSIDFGNGRAVKAGQVGYFPEGTAYGPQDITAQDAIVLQCGGASGQGFLTGEELRSGRAALEAKGRFEGGVFIRDDAAAGRRNQDGYEAVWEEVTGRRLAYPPARYLEPVVMDPGSFAWRRAAAGVRTKHLGTFGERRLGLEIVGIEAGARHDLVATDALRLAYGIEGATRGRAVAIEPGETASIEPDGATTFFMITLPPVALHPATAVPESL